MSTQQQSSATGVGVILPADLSSELCIANLTSAAGNRLLQFRIDPGDAFERRAFIRYGLDGRFHLGIREMYLPDDLYRNVCGSDGIPASDIPDQLRTLSGYAYTLSAGRPHWTQARRVVKPVRSGGQWAAAPRAADLATEAAAYYAQQSNTTYYLHLAPGRYRYANNPPDRAEFCSVTPLGLWSQHEGTATYPLDAAPAEAAFLNRDQRRPARTAALIADADQPMGQLIIGPFHPDGSTAARPSRREPRRGRRP